MQQCTKKLWNGQNVMVKDSVSELGAVQPPYFAGAGAVIFVKHGSGLDK